MFYNQCSDTCLILVELDREEMEANKLGFSYNAESYQGCSLAGDNDNIVEDTVAKDTFVSLVSNPSLSPGKLPNSVAKLH